MKVIVTGAAGFLGARVAESLLNNVSQLPVTELVLVDTQLPRCQSHSYIRVHNLALDLTKPAAADSLVDADCDILFHLAAIVSGHAEVDFDLGLQVNIDSTRYLLEAARRKAPLLKFIFTSTVGVFGGDLPPVVNDLTAVMPQNSYGTAKAICELLINDYSRKGFVDGRVVRLPTVSVRSGAANKAVTSFASGIVREPLNGIVAVCPVAMEQGLWLCSPATVVHNIIHAATLPAKMYGVWRVVNLPGISVTVDKIIEALKSVAGEETAALVSFEPDDVVSRIVATFPSKFDNERARRLGFIVDTDFKDIIRAYIRNDLKK